jgi:hypothetical protein
MLYPKIVNVKKSREVTVILEIISVILSVILMIINYVFSLKLDWSIIVIVSIIYLWISTVYALDKNVNLASYTLFQMIVLSIFLFIIDFVFGFTRWSLSIGIPIVIMVSNVTMMIITMIKHKKYMKYAVYVILILLFSIVYDIIISMASNHSPLLNIITLWVSITNLSFVLIFNFDIIKIELQKKFHI